MLPAVWILTCPHPLLYLLVVPIWLDSAREARHCSWILGCVTLSASSSRAPLQDAARSSVVHEENGVLHRVFAFSSSEQGCWTPRAHARGSRELLGTARLVTASASALFLFLGHGIRRDSIAFSTSLAAELQDVSADPTSQESTAQLLFFFVFLWALSRRLVAQDETSNRHQCWSENQQMKCTHQHQFRCFLLTGPSLKRGEPLFSAVANSHSKGGARPPFDLLNNKHNTAARLKRRESLIPKRHKVFTVRKNSEKEDTNRPAQTSKDLTHVPSSFIMVPGSLQGARLGPRLLPSRVREQTCAVCVRSGASSEWSSIT